MRKHTRSAACASALASLSVLTFAGLIENSFQMALYEHFKSLTLRYRYNGEDHDLKKSEYLLCATSAKFIASAATYPHEVRVSHALACRWNIFMVEAMLFRHALKCEV